MIYELIYIIGYLQNTQANKNIKVYKVRVHFWKCTCSRQSVMVKWLIQAAILFLPRQGSRINFSSALLGLYINNQAYGITKSP